MSDVKMTDNSDKVVDEMTDKVAAALEAIGLAAEGFAKANVQQAGRIDTGRLWNSITHATKQFPGKGNYTDKNGNAYSDATKQAEPDKGAVYIGTNVDYAPYVEIGTVKMAGTHYLKNAVAEHGDDFKKIAEKVMKN